MQRARASAVARELLARSPAGSVLSIFAAGSLGRDEVWSAEIDGVLEIYSDIDLCVVVTDERALSAVRDAARADVDPVAGARFLRPPDVGVYTVDDLAAQPVRPGTVDLAARHVVLHGDASVPRRLPAHHPSSIDASEALYLLENRVAELAEAGAVTDGPGARMALVRALKARLDIHAAHLLVEGTFDPALHARAARASSPATMDTDAREEAAAAYRIAADLRTWLATADAFAEAERSLRALARAWGTLAPIVLGAPGETRPEVLVPMRCRGGARRANAREAIRLRHAFGVPVWRAMAVAPALSAMSPRAALRVDALIRRFHIEGRVDARRCAAHERYVERLTAWFGFRRGPVEKRVQAMRRVIS